MNKFAPPPPSKSMVIFRTTKRGWLLIDIRKIKGTANDKNSLLILFSATSNTVTQSITRDFHTS